MVTKPKMTRKASSWLPTPTFSSKINSRTNAIAFERIVMANSKTVELISLDDRMLKARILRQL